jgi:hypothetical protein
LRNIVKSEICVVGDIKADRTIIMCGSIRVVMKCKPQNGEGEKDE